MKITVDHIATPGSILTVTLIQMPEKKIFDFKLKKWISFPPLLTGVPFPEITKGYFFVQFDVDLPSDGNYFALILSNGVVISSRDFQVRNNSMIYPYPLPTKAVINLVYEGENA